MWYIVSWREKCNMKVDAKTADEALHKVLEALPVLEDEEFEIEDLERHVHNTDEPSDYDG